MIRAAILGGLLLASLSTPAHAIYLEQWFPFPEVTAMQERVALCAAFIAEAPRSQWPTYRPGAWPESMSGADRIAADGITTTLMGSAWAIQATCEVPTGYYQPNGVLTKLPW